MEATNAAGELRGKDIDGVRFDDNTYANVAIKRATGLRKSAVGFEACHIWPLTCYDERYHTAPANLVLLPRALAGLSDHDPEIQKALQYRAFELYGWWPSDGPRPVNPEFYPTEWRDPQPDVRTVRNAGKVGSQGGGSLSAEENRRELDARLEAWSRKPHTNVHKIISLVVHVRDSVSRRDLAKQIAEVTSSRNPEGSIASLCTNAGNAYGRVLIADNGLVSLHPDVEGKVRSLPWTSL